MGPFLYLLQTPSSHLGVRGEGDNKEGVKVEGEVEGEGRGGVGEGEVEGERKGTVEGVRGR